MLETFIVRAQTLVERIDAGERVDAEVAALRDDWRGLSAIEQADAREVVAALAARTRRESGRTPREGPARVQTAWQAEGARAQGARRADAQVDEQAEAQRALQGTLALTERGPTRYYDGPGDPDALLAHYGLDAFRAGQREVVTAALQGRDSLVIMPTGGGKSLCYTLPGLATDALTVVVSPLIALMSDQYRRLAAGGHPAVMIASGLSEEQHRESMRAIRDGTARIAFCSPERFGSKAFLDTLESRKIALFAVDEAHCVSEWGHDFRPDYLRLHDALQRLGRPPVMACTATATPEVATEITQRLDLRDPLIVQGGFDRPNLSFDVLTFEGEGSVELRFATLAAILGVEHALPAIVYAGTRKDVETISDRLRSLGRSAVGYHAGMAPDERASAQHRFLSGDAEVVVATNAFGMGVDKPDVRTVAHVTVPSSIEAYYQEAGRAGRDGAPARAVLLASRSDLGRLVRFNQQRSTSAESVAGYLAHLRSAAAEEDRLTIAVPREDEQRTALAIAERAGALTLAPAGGGQLDVTLTGQLDRRRTEQICRIAKDRGWRAYRAIEQYAYDRETCRRQKILGHFGDPSPGSPSGRCCDVCDPPDWLPPVTVTKRPRAAKAKGASGGQVAPSVVDLSVVDQRLYQSLAAWRREAAEGKPAYTVASNATLTLIASKRPRDSDELHAIRGVGPAFIESYGEAVLALVARDGEHLAP